MLDAPEPVRNVDGAPINRRATGYSQLRHDSRNLLVPCARDRGLYPCGKEPRSRYTSRSTWPYAYLAPRPSSRSWCDFGGRRLWSSPFVFGTGGVLSIRFKTSSPLFSSTSFSRFAMRNPWERFHYPVIGEVSEDVLFAALGRALNRWEWVECGLSIVYSLFSNDPTFRKAVDYGLGRKIFKDRIDGLKNVAEAWFVSSPNQETEARLDKIIEATVGFSERRNEIAHGVVMDVSGMLFWRQKLTCAPINAQQFLVIPALHSVRQYDSLGMPAFGYSAHQLGILHDHICDLELEIDSFKSSLWPTLWPKESP